MRRNVAFLLPSLQLHTTYLSPPLYSTGCRRVKRLALKFAMVSNTYLLLMLGEWGG